MSGNRGWPAGLSFRATRGPCSTGCGGSHDLETQRQTRQLGPLCVYLCTLSSFRRGQSGNAGCSAWGRAPHHEKDVASVTGSSLAHGQPSVSSRQAVGPTLSTGMAGLPAERAGERRRAPDHRGEVEGEQTGAACSQVELSGPLHRAPQHRLRYV